MRQETGLRAHLLSFLEDETGATAIEYGLVIVLLALALVPALGDVYEAIDDVFKKIDSDLDANTS